MPQIDATDTRILLALARDSRASGVELAQRLDLSRNTVQSRLAKLEAGQALAPIDRRVATRALGYSITAFVTARVDQHQLTAPGVERTEVAVSLREMVTYRTAPLLHRVAGVESGS